MIPQNQVVLMLPQSQFYGGVEQYFPQGIDPNMYYGMQMNSTFNQSLTQGIPMNQTYGAQFMPQLINPQLNQFQGIPQMMPFAQVNQ